MPAAFIMCWLVSKLDTSKQAMMEKAAYEAQYVRSENRHWRRGRSGALGPTEHLRRGGRRAAPFCLAGSHAAAPYASTA